MRGDRLDRLIRPYLEARRRSPEKRHPRVSPAQRRRVLERDGYRCQHCGAPHGIPSYDPGTRYLEMDHVIPLSRGGKTVFENLQALCSSCNGKKGTSV